MWGLYVTDRKTATSMFFATPYGRHSMLIYHRPQDRNIHVFYNSMVETVEMIIGDEPRRGGHPSPASNVYT